MTVKGMKTNLNKLAECWDKRYKLYCDGKYVAIITRYGKVIEKVKIPNDNELAKKIRTGLFMKELFEE